MVASNFLCRMDAPSAERCLRNLAQLRALAGTSSSRESIWTFERRLRQDLGWEPVSDLREEIHDGDPLVRADWPWEWWGLEPLDRSRPDWQTRYASFFQVGRRQ